MSPRRGNSLPRPRGRTRAWPRHTTTSESSESSNATGGGRDGVPASRRSGTDLAAAHDRLGFVLGQRGKTDDAIAEFERAVAIDPDLARRPVSPWRDALVDQAAGSRAAAARSGRSPRACTRGSPVLPRTHVAAARAISTRRSRRLREAIRAESAARAGPRLPRRGAAGDGRPRRRGGRADRGAAPRPGAGRRGEHARAGVHGARRRRRRPSQTLRGRS